ncbi:MAG: hypothetical protein JNJ57_14895 [Saprospiraceae bacterium]|nr:hypothetical protein [Saprospiraceae bacterium]
MEQPDTDYLNGLKNADPQTVEILYQTFRKPVARAVEAAGGSHADGNTFFRVAVIQTAMLAEKGEIAEETPIFDFIKNLAVAHFRDWAAEKQLELPEPPPLLEGETTVLIPNESDRLEIRQFVRAKRQWLRLDEKCRANILNQAENALLSLDPDPRFSTDETNACLTKYRQALGITTEASEDSLPAPIVTALTNEPFNRIWNTAESLESRLSLGQSVKKEPESKTTRNILIGMALFTLAYAAWAFLTAPKSVKEIYKENYNPPVSIMADRAERAARDSVDVSLPEPCEALLEAADQYYQQKNWSETAGILANMIGDDSEVCKSDALFYLGVVALQMEEPYITIECLAKISDLERFGEDLYWYQALAYVKIATENPMRRSTARKAVERARSNTELPERRAQAEKMLKDLED